MISTSVVTRCGAIILTGLAAASLAACGSSATAPTASSASPSTAAAASPSTAAPAGVKERTSGIVGTKNGTTITLTNANGPATVDLSPSTKVRQLTAATLTDVAAGQCVVVRPTKDSAGSPTVTAASVLFGPAENGQCAAPGKQRGNGVIGTVASVTASSIVATLSDGSQSTVTVSPGTHYAERTTGDPSVIAAGQCLLAQGIKAADGSIQATSVNVRPAASGPCGPKHPSS